jgi:hypothetical protein
MINMQAYDVYRSYLALRLHFTTDKYDVIQQQGRVKATKQSFFKRTDLFAIRKIAESYSDKEVVDFLVANFITGDRWGGVFDSEAKENYLAWKKRMESIKYTFTNEVDKMVAVCEKQNIKFDDLFINNSGQHPLFFKMYLRKMISIETLVILNKLNNYTERLDKELSSDLMWPDTSRIIKKYSPFLTIDKEKYVTILRTRLGCSVGSNG